MPKVTTRIDVSFRIFLKKHLESQFGKDEILFDDSGIKIYERKNAEFKVRREFFPNGVWEGLKYLLKSKQLPYRDIIEVDTDKSEKVAEMSDFTLYSEDPRAIITAYSRKWLLILKEVSIAYEEFMAEDSRKVKIYLELVLSYDKKVEEKLAEAEERWSDHQGDDAESLSSSLK